MRLGYRQYRSTFVSVMTYANNTVHLKSILNAQLSPLSIPFNLARCRRRLRQFDLVSPDMTQPSTSSTSIPWYSWPLPTYHAYGTTQYDSSHFKLYTTVGGAKVPSE